MLHDGVAAAALVLLALALVLVLQGYLYKGTCTSTCTSTGAGATPSVTVIRFSLSQSHISPYQLLTCLSHTFHFNLKHFKLSFQGFIY